MKVLGIDFGTKRIGLAISDDEGSFAFPLKTIEHNQGVFDEIISILQNRAVDVVVLGDPGNNEDAQHTKKKILDFKKKLESFGVTIVLQNEAMTSLNSDLFGTKKPIARKWGGERKEKKDENAAAFILQRYLDRKK